MRGTWRPSTRTSRRGPSVLSPTTASNESSISPSNNQSSHGSRYTSPLLFPSLLTSPHPSCVILGRRGYGGKLQVRPQPPRQQLHLLGHCGIYSFTLFHPLPPSLLLSLLLPSSLFVSLRLSSHLMSKVSKVLKNVCSSTYRIKVEQLCSKARLLFLEVLEVAFDRLPLLFPEHKVTQGIFLSSLLSLSVSLSLCLSL